MGSVLPSVYLLVRALGYLLRWGGKVGVGSGVGLAQADSKPSARKNSMVRVVPILFFIQASLHCPEHESGVRPLYNVVDLNASLKRGRRPEI